MSTESPIKIIKKSSNFGVRIPGLFPSSIVYGQQVVSTGIPSLDSYIGGGIPIGSICLIWDKFPSRFGTLIQKCFIAEGSSYNHHNFVVSGKRQSSKTFANELPSSKKQNYDNERNPTQNDVDLKIAWRYKDPPSYKGSVRGQKEAKYEFTKKLKYNELGGTNLYTFEPKEKYMTLIKEILNYSKQFSLDSAESTKNFLRISIAHLDNIKSPHFFKLLRSIVRNTNSCALLCLSADDSSSDSNFYECEHLADIVLSLEMIIEEKRQIELGDIDGLLLIEKVASLNTIKPFIPARDIGFSFRRKRLTFQDMNIPPEGESDSINKESESNIAKASSSSSSCGTTFKGKSIDF